MTSNESIDAIKELLDRESKKDSNIGINYTIHQSVEFLDVLIENNQEHLKTSVFRKPAAEPYILPYTSDHPRHIHSNTIYTALLRAIRLSSDIEKFDQERLNIEISLILNGYSPKFITYHFQRFFRKYDALSLYKRLDNKQYQKLHQALLHNSTQSNEKQNELEQPQPQGEKNKVNEQVTLKQKEIIIHCRFETGPIVKFNNLFRKTWEKHFCCKNSPLNNVRLILATKTNPTLECLLVKKKPAGVLLRSMDEINDNISTSNHQLRTHTNFTLNSSI